MKIWNYIIPQNAQKLLSTTTELEAILVNAWKFIVWRVFTLQSSSEMI